VPVREQEDQHTPAAALGFYHLPVAVRVSEPRGGHGHVFDLFDLQQELAPQHTRTVHDIVRQTGSTDAVEVVVCCLVEHLTQLLLQRPREQGWSRGLKRLQEGVLNMRAMPLQGGLKRLQISHIRR
jgi:hypothetical protein